MQSLAAFFEHNIIVVYFFYGLAFFCMGLLVWIESRRSSSMFPLAEAIGPLAGFGIIHGLHEWFEMFQRLRDATNIPAWLLSDVVRIGHLVISFALLMVFGVRLVYAHHRNGRRNELFLAYAAAGGLLALWVISVMATDSVYNPSRPELLIAADVLSRYILAIPGATLAAWAIVLEQQTFRSYGLVETGRDLLRAALALVIYGLIGQVFVTPSFLFPANIINADLFIRTFGIPVQLFRAMAAALVAIFVVRALRAFDLERQQRLAEANEARLAAQSEALRVQQEAQQETEQLNQDLTVLFDFARSLAETLDRDELVQTAVHNLVRNLPWVMGAAVCLRDRPTQQIRMAAHASREGVPFESWAHTAGQVSHHVIDANRPAFVDAHGIHTIPPPHENGSRSQWPARYVGVPLPAQESPMGCMGVYLGPADVLVNQRWLSLLRTLAGQLGIAVENATLYKEVRERETLRGELLHQVVSAQERERQRIARELHDGTGQSLTALGLGFAAVGETVHSDPQRAARQLTELKKISMHALEELRDLIANLRPSLLDDLGLAAALQSQVNDFERRLANSERPIRARMHVSGAPYRLSPDVENIAYRIAQEALTNVAKHAQARQVDVTLRYDDDCLRLTVHDDGVGFDSASVMDQTGQRRAWGLLGIQERVALAGGKFNIHAEPGSGATIEVCLPHNQAEKVEEHV